MRLISNEELMNVSGGEIGSPYTPFGDWEGFDDILGRIFEHREFGDDYAEARRTSETKPSKSEMAEVAAELRKALPGAIITCTATANNKGPNGAVQWELTCTVTIKTKG